MCVGVCVCVERENASGCELCAEKRTRTREKAEARSESGRDGVKSAEGGSQGRSRMSPPKGLNDTTG